MPFLRHSPVYDIKIKVYKKYEHILYKNRSYNHNCRQFSQHFSKICSIWETGYRTESSTHIGIIVLIAKPTRFPWERNVRTASRETLFLHSGKFPDLPPETALLSSLATQFTIFTNDLLPARSSHIFALRILI